MKVTPIRPTSEEMAARRTKMDDLGEVRRRLALAEPDIELEKLLSKEIQSWFQDSAGDRPESARGNLYEIQLTARRNERTVLDKKKAFNCLKKALGLDGLIAVLDIPLGVLDKNLPESVRSAFIHQEHSGYRTLTAVPIHAAAPEPDKKAA